MVGLLALVPVEAQLALAEEEVVLVSELALEAVAEAVAWLLVGLVVVAWLPVGLVVVAWLRAEEVLLVELVEAV